MSIIARSGDTLNIRMPKTSAIFTHVIVWCAPGGFSDHRPRRDSVLGEVRASSSGSFRCAPSGSCRAVYAGASVILLYLFRTQLKYPTDVMTSRLKRPGGPYDAPSHRHPLTS